MDIPCLDCAPLRRTRSRFSFFPSNDGQLLARAGSMAISQTRQEQSTEQMYVCLKDGIVLTKMSSVFRLQNRRLVFTISSGILVDSHSFVNFFVC